VLFKTKEKCPEATIIMTTFFNGAMDILKITKTVKTLNLARKQILSKK